MVSVKFNYILRASSSHVWYENWTIKLSDEELMLLNCGAGGDV